MKQPKRVATSRTRAGMHERTYPRAHAHGRTRTRTTRTHVRTHAKELIQTHVRTQRKTTRTHTHNVQIFHKSDTCTNNTQSHTRPHPAQNRTRARNVRNVHTHHKSDTHTRARMLQTNHARTQTRARTHARTHVARACTPPLACGDMIACARACTHMQVRVHAHALARLRPHTQCKT
jgi:hypothetical protein